MYRAACFTRRCDVTRRNIQSIVSANPKRDERHERSECREFDVRRTKSLLLVYLRKPSPDGCFARTCGRSRGVARVKSSRNRFRRFETSSFVNVFRAFAWREFVPMSFPARAFASRTPPARTLLVVSFFRARGKKTSGRTVLRCCCFRVWRERRACTVPLCARHVDIIFPYEVEQILHFCDAQKHTQTHAYSSCKSS